MTGGGRILDTVRKIPIWAQTSDPASPAFVSGRGHRGKGETAFFIFLFGQHSGNRGGNIFVFACPKADLLFFVNTRYPGQRTVVRV
jgi:hypothetical protein